MTQRSIIYYITGHGFGHGRRAAEVMQAVLNRDPAVMIHVRTSAPAWLFAHLGPRVRWDHAEVDPGCAEANLLRIDPEATAAGLRAFLAGVPAVLEREIGFLRSHAPSLLLADVPFIAGDLARATGVRCIAISNFTWDWIYEELFAGMADRTALTATIRERYSGVQTLLRIPWGGVANTFNQVIDAPLIARRSTMSRDEFLIKARIDPQDHRPLVFVALRGGIAPEVLRAAADSAQDCRFLCLGETEARWPENISAISTDAAGVDFSDVLAMSDVVVSKIGYGIIAECIAMRKRLLWPRRVGFREDELSEREAQRYIPMRELPMEQFESGVWGESIRALLKQPMPDCVARTDGAAVCAEWVLRALARDSSVSARL